MKEWTPPTQENLLALPLLSMLAFSVRCSTRVKHLYQDDAEAAEVLDGALALAKAGLIVDDAGAFAELVSETVEKEFNDYHVRDLAARSVSETVRAYLNVWAMIKYGDSSRKAVAIAVENAARLAADAVAGVAGFPAWPPAADAGDPLFARFGKAMHRDYRLLITASMEEDWADNSRVLPEFFGPLWPDGAPEGWPCEGPDDDSSIRLRIQIPEGISDNKAIEQFKELLADMNAYDAAMGGSGIKIKSLQARRAAGSPRGTPV